MHDFYSIIKKMVRTLRTIFIKKKIKTEVILLVISVKKI